MDDAFADLLLTDPEDEQPQMTSREARIARAFEQSKQSYASEIVVTPPGWFQIEHIQADDLTKLEARNVEWSVQRLYLQKSYAAALQLAVEVLYAGGVELDLTDGITTSLNHNIDENDRGTLPKNEARDREMLDVAIRCAIKLGDRNAAIDLARATRSRWANSPGLGYTAGEAFVFAGRPLDAISALLHAVRARTPSYSILSLLVQALDAAAVESSKTSAPAFKKLADIINQYAERIKPAFERGLFPEASATPGSKPPPKSKSTVLPEAVVRDMGGEAGLDETDIGLLIALCCTDVPVQVDTGSSDIWLYDYESNLLDTALVHNATNLTLGYGIGSVSGPISQIDMSLAGFNAANQSFIKVQSHQNQVMIDDHLCAGILGLGFDTLSHISNYVRGAYSSTWGRGIMTNIFDANPTTSKHIAFRLDRLYDNDLATGSFDIGTFAPGFEAVNDTAPTPVFSVDSARLGYWSVLLDAINVNGVNQTLKSTISIGDTKPPQGKLSVLLDTGYSSPQIPEDVFHALYTSMGGVLVQDGTNSSYAVPCMAEANLTFYIGDKPIPVHPLDLTSVGTFNNGTNMTVCLSDFEPYTGAAGGGVLDMILGDAFLRNAYTVFNFGSLVDGIFGSPSGNPYVKILPLTEPKSASADFKKARTAQLAKLPPQVDVTTYNDAHPKAAQEQVKAAKHTSISGNVCAAIAVGAAILVLVVIGWLVMKNRNHKMNWFQAKVNAIRGSNERYNPV